MPALSRLKRIPVVVVRLLAKGLGLNCRAAGHRACLDEAISAQGLGAFSAVSGDQT
jgi:hypothetical protein